MEIEAGLVVCLPRLLVVKRQELEWARVSEQKRFSVICHTELQWENVIEVIYLKAGIIGGDYF